MKMGECDPPSVAGEAISFLTGVDLGDFPFV